MRYRHGSLRGAGLVLALLLVGTACGPSSGGDAASSEGAGSSTTPGQAKKGGTIVFATAADWPGMDPQLASSGVAMVVQNHVFEGLVTRDRTIDTDSAPIKPALATSWTVSPDGRVYTFKLRQGVTFHDGTPFNAAAVEFNFRRWRDPTFKFYSEVAAGNTASLMQLVESTRVVDDATFELTMKTPSAGLIDRLTGTSFYYIVSPAAVEKYGNDGFAQHGVGTGPFKVAQFVRGQRTRLVRNEKYWGKPTNLDEVVFRPIPDAGARVAAVVAGEVDIAMEIPPDSIATIESSGSAKVTKLGKPATFTIMPNMREAPFNNPLVREAVSMAIDRKAIVDNLFSGAASEGTQLFGKGNPGFDPSLGVQSKYDPKRAKELLAQAGYPNGFTTKMPCSPAGTGIPATDQVMEAIQSDLAKVGIKVQLDMTEWNAYITRWLKGIPQGQGIGAWCMAIGTDDAFILSMYTHSKNSPPVGWATGWYSDPKVDKLLDAADAAPNYDGYIKLYRDAQKVMLEDLGYIFVLHDTGPYAVSNRVKGWVPARSWLQDVSRAWVEG
ncbi:MAG: glutathione transporter substrate-binding protein [Acidimicrobiales bacterium]|nr:glutathione transporter substrate-binding protein [Acidimicrobiales bacterium]